MRPFSPDFRFVISGGRRARWLGVALSAILLGACDLATIRPLDPATGRAIVEEAEEAFDAASFVTRNWESRILPAAAAGVDLHTLTTALARDSAAASESHGHRAGSGAYSFLVSGTARVLEVDTASRSGVARIDLEPADGEADASIQLGPVFRGTALRDALPFIRFGDFTNQMEYAAVSRLLHERVTSDVLGAVDRSTLAGRTVRFQGAFTPGADGPLVTPVLFRVED